jgi:hypothetical protein
MEPKSKGAAPEWLQMEAQLTEQERALRDRFVDEYLVDYDATKACMRVGFSLSFAVEYGKQFICEAYVQKRIKRAEQLKLDAEAAHDYDANRVRAVLMRWAHCDHGPTAVAAARQLCVIMGLDGKPEEEEGSAGVQGGVMMVPAIADVDEWEKTAVQSQQKLTEFARADVR